VRLVSVAPGGASDEDLDEVRGRMGPLFVPFVPAGSATEDAALEQLTSRLSRPGMPEQPPHPAKGGAG